MDWGRRGVIRETEGPGTRDTCWKGLGKKTIGCAEEDRSGGERQAGG